MLFTAILLGHIIYLKLQNMYKIPFGLVVRIPGFHPGGPGSIPGMGSFYFLTFLITVYHSNNNYVSSSHCGDIASHGELLAGKFINVSCIVLVNINSCHS